MRVKKHYRMETFFLFLMMWLYRSVVLLFIMAKLEMAKNDNLEMCKFICYLIWIFFHHLDTILQCLFNKLYCLYLTFVKSLNINIAKRSSNGKQIFISNVQKMDIFFPFKFCHNRKMAASGFFILLLLFCPSGYENNVTPTYIEGMVNWCF